MTMRMTCLCAVAAAAFALPSGARANVELGALFCHSDGGTGMVVVSELKLDCAFTPAAGGPAHRYVGVIRRYGLDLGVTQDVKFGWAVFAPTGVVAPGDLAGSYGGVQGNASVVVGAGANALAGGSSNSFTLQPVSAEGQTGLNVSAGVTELVLSAAVAPVPYRHHRHHQHRL